MSEAKTFEDWMKMQYSNLELKEISRYGCVSGVSGLIYHSETSALYQRYKDNIWEILSHYADEYGYTDVIRMVCGSNWDGYCTNSTVFENYLVWMAAEVIAFRLSGG